MKWQKSYSILSLWAVLPNCRICVFAAICDSGKSFAGIFESLAEKQSPFRIFAAMSKQMFLLYELTNNVVFVREVKYIAFKNPKIERNEKGVLVSLEIQLIVNNFQLSLEQRIALHVCCFWAPLATVTVISIGKGWRFADLREHEALSFTLPGSAVVGRPIATPSTCLHITESTIPWDVR